MSRTQSTVLIVDDTALNIDILVEALGNEYDISVAMDGATALELVADNPPDIILLDVMMPEMDGYEVCARLKAKPLTADIPVIFLTALNGPEDKAKGFQVGAVDYMEKPFSIVEIRARLSAHLALLLARRELKAQNRILEQKVRERTAQLLLTQNAIIESMANLAETRSPEIGVHILRTKYFVGMLGEELRQQGAFPSFFAHIDIEELGNSALLHDIGKVGISDRVLMKKGKLSPHEYDTIKQHTTIGRDILHRSRQKLGVSSFLQMAEEIAWCHHEHMDGSGYPRGIAGEEIPVSARVMAVADVYDAMIGPRFYKPSVSHDEAVAFITEHKGSHFDPQVVAAFLALQDSFWHIARHVFPDDYTVLQALPENEGGTAEFRVNYE